MTAPHVFAEAIALLKMAEHEIAAMTFSADAYETRRDSGEPYETLRRVREFLRAYGGEATS